MELRKGAHMTTVETPMTPMQKFDAAFGVKKPIFAMLHLKGDSHDAVFEQAKRELDIYLEGGVDAVIVENYYGGYEDMVRMLDYMKDEHIDTRFGINCLRFDSLGFHLARTYGATFVQLDSVIGHVDPRDESAEAAFLEHERSSYDGLVLGGVRFKYQPMKSVNPLDVDLQISKGRCDAVVVTQDATGQETSMDKINEFRAGLGEFPLVIGAGVTPDNAAAGFSVADAAIVGSYFKDTYKDTGDVCLDHVRTFMARMREIREEL